MGPRPPGRDARNLLRRHQPVVRRRHRSAPPGRDHAAVGDRQHRHHAVPGRTVQHRIRPGLDQGACSRCPARPPPPAASRGRSSASSRATGHARPTRSCTGRSPNQIAMVRANRYFVPSVANPLAPVTFVHKIHVPVYLACQFTDEQTGGHCADLAQDFTGTSRNGSPSPTARTSTRWTRRRSTAGIDFLQLFVAHRQPQLSDAVKALAPTVFSTAMGIDGVTLPPDPIQSEPSYAAALAAFQALQADPRDVRQRRRQQHSGRPYPAFERSFSRFPDPRDAGAVLVSGQRRQAEQPARRSAARVMRSPGRPGPGRRRASPARTAAARAGCGRPRRRTTGRPTPPAPPRPT